VTTITGALARRRMTEDDSMTPHAERATDVLTALRRLVHLLYRTSRETERALGVTGAQLFVLQRLAEGPVGSLNELAERTATHQSSVSVVVRRVIERGLVARRRSSDDRRRMEFWLTPKGERLLARSPTATQARLIAALAELPERRLQALEQGLSTVIRVMGADAEPAGMFFEDDRRARGSRGAKAARGARSARGAPDDADGAGGSAR
jgi:DNA-binding MarR family transcriptional regulator